ncbi:MAG TPA: hypothetical protein VKU39_20090 [Streptosporangiaceae bacterium]|nr:hypothetical protein [Streptosporangiaceae bacterium]
MSVTNPYDNPYDWERLMRAADAAPSLLNTRPWQFECVAEDRIDLRPEWSRHLTVIDRRHRELVISCGAALFNVRLAIRVAGHDPVVWLLPDEQPGEGGPPCPHCGSRCGIGELLASVELVIHRTHSATRTEQRLYEQIQKRRTVREPFTGKVPLNVLAELEQAARREGALARLLYPRESRKLVREAAAVGKAVSADTSYLAEQGMWTGEVSGDLGIPADRFGPKPADPAHSPVRDFGARWQGDRSEKEFEKHPQFIALQTLTDTPQDWLRVGQALQRLLLTATYFGVQTSFLTQTLEIADRDLHQRIRRPWPWPPVTQMLIRVGASDSAGQAG